MDRSTLDLYRSDFWLTLAVAVAVLTPLTRPAIRQWAWAVVNLAFVGYLLGPADMTYAWELVQQGAFGDAAMALAATDLLKVCGAVFVAHGVLQAVARHWLGALPLAMGGMAAAALFVIHKLPALASVENLGPLKAVLVTVGFSYVALRLADALRSVRDGVQPAPNLAATVNYLLPFHMLAAGPIQPYADFQSQPAVPPPLTASDALRGVERIATGLFKKYVLANLIDEIFLSQFRAPFPYLVLEVQCYYLWFYLDFSAYSDIAVGAGRLMGVATPENFNRPYLARNLIDFWDRWHISLSQFIRRNLFIPIQLNLMRRTSGRAALWCATAAFSVSFLFCGLWHGLETRWALWGGMHALGLVAASWYRDWLRRRLSREALNRYMANRGIRLAATILTQEFVASTLMVVGWSR
jgi:D-alanyl-lipoteichoic acid acyltransferase DltB (MBOAT superfamily)